MNKKIICLSLFIKSILCISIILGQIKFDFVIIQQQNDSAIQLVKIYERLQKNYIINVRPVDDQTQCNLNETSISAFLYQYQHTNISLDYIQIGEEDHKQIIRLCYERHLDNNFITLKQQNEQYIKQDQDECIYKGISFKQTEETRKCPISDIRFSTQESIPNYEKIQIQNSNKLNLFLKRSDQNKVPLIDIYLSKEDFEDKQIDQIENISFSMDDICKKYQNQFKYACLIKSEPQNIKFHLFQETHLPIDCDPNAEFLTKKLYFFLYSNDAVLMIILELLVNFLYSYPQLVYFIDGKDYYEKEVAPRKGTLIIVKLLFIIFQLILTQTNYDKLQTFRKIIKLLQSIQYFNEDPLKNIYEKAQLMNQLFCIIIWPQIILFLIDVLLEIFLKSKKVIKFMRLEETEIQQLN